MEDHYITPASRTQEEMFRPPVDRAMRVLDKSFFQKDILLSAARVFEPSKIARIRGQLDKSKDMLAQRMVMAVQTEPMSNTKCVLLRPEIRHDDRSTWSQMVRQLHKSNDIAVVPFNLKLEYKYWTAQEILAAILPEELHDNQPHSFAAVGHIAHFNLREPYLPYKHLIAQVTMHKNPNITSVINKTETLDITNTFRTLPFELLAGEPDYDVTLKEHGTTFSFDFSKVFWNTRLETEHARLVSLFQPKEAVCDVMAGVGPFAVPAGKKGVFVYANDLNPHCFDGLRKSVKINQVEEFVRPFQLDGREFIRSATKSLLEEPPIARTPKKGLSRRERSNVKRSAASMSPSPPISPPPPHIPALPSASELRTAPNTVMIQAPRTFSHYIMNLPALAPTFLPSFRGIYFNHAHLFRPHTVTPLPLIHCYCFGPQVDSDNGMTREKVEDEVVGVVESELGVSMRLAKEGETGEAGTTKDQRWNYELQVRNVRDVAPNKQEICVSFRLPEDVAFAKPDV